MNTLSGKLLYTSSDDSNLSVYIEFEPKPGKIIKHTVFYGKQRVFDEVVDLLCEKYGSIVTITLGASGPGISVSTN